MMAADNKIIIMSSLNDSLRNLIKGAGGSSKILFIPNSSFLKRGDSMPFSNDVFNLERIP